MSRRTSETTSTRLLRWLVVQPSNRKDRYQPPVHMGTFSVPSAIHAASYTHFIAVDRVLRYPYVGQEDFDVVVIELYPMDMCCPALDDSFPTLDQPYLALMPEGDWT